MSIDVESKLERVNCPILLEKLYDDACDYMMEVEAR